MAAIKGVARAAAANPIDITMFGKNNLKKAISVMSAVIRPQSISTADGVVTNGTIAVGDNLILANLPANCIVTNAMIYIRTHPTNTTSQLTIKCGTDNLIAATAVGSASDKVLGSLVGKVSTGTGKQIIAEVSTADLTDGEIEVVVEYMEITRTTGEFTR